MSCIWEQNCSLSFQVVRMDSSGKSKIWSKCSVVFVWYLLGLINRRDTARDRDFHLLNSSRAQKDKEEVQGLAVNYIFILST